ncbi:MAG: hypothetical protein Q9162_007401 [Coniocarpon cinnabarinum]
MKLAVIAALLPQLALVVSQGFSLSLPPPFPVPTNNPVGCDPTASSNGPQQSFTVNYNFESVERAVPGLTTTVIGIYNMLSFNMNYANTDPDLDGNHLGSAPHSYPDVAAFSANTNLFNLTGPASITADYVESTISYFQPQSWYYGCVFATEESAGSLPNTCDITATGFDSKLQVRTFTSPQTARRSRQFQNSETLEPAIEA